MSFKVLLVHSRHQNLTDAGVAFLRAHGIPVEEGGVGLHWLGISRHHPVLVRMVEELGECAFQDLCARDIDVREVPVVSRYIIERDWDTNHETLLLEHTLEWVDPTA